MSGENADLVRAGFEAFLRGDVDTLRDSLDPEAQWLWFESNPGDCYDRESLLETLQARQNEGVVTGVDQIIDGGAKVFVEITGPTLDAWDLPDGKACMVVTVRDSKIVRLQDHPSRAAALADAGLAPKPRRPVPAPPAERQVGADRVIGLVPYVHVTDVARSIAFYEHFGFQVTASYPTDAPVITWASLDSDSARIMLARADEPLHADQGVMFYLYSPDLFALRDRLLAAGIEVGEIVDGSPGPSAEMRVEDPDGYVLSIAQLELSGGASSE